MHKSVLQNRTLSPSYRYIQTVGTLRALATLVSLPYHQVDIKKETKWAGNIARMMDEKIHVRFDGVKSKERIHWKTWA
jgi:hypothetical protein